MNFRNIALFSLILSIASGIPAADCYAYAPFASGVSASTALSAAANSASGVAVKADEGRKRIDLSGKWNFSLKDVPDSVRSYAVMDGTLTLPGTLDSNHAGIKTEPTQSTDNLARRFTYMGEAVYSRTVDIPDEASGKRLVLNLERTRPTKVKVDGIDAGSLSQISATQRYDLTPFLTPGKHLIEITVDNGQAIPPAVRNSSHACTEATQTNWNGITGEMFIEMTDPVHISGLRLKPDAAGKAFIVEGSVARTPDAGPLTVTASANGETVTKTLLPNEADDFSLYLPLGADARLWSEWDPALYDVTVTLKEAGGRVIDSLTRRSGVRDFSTSGTHFTINGSPIFLRGRHDACVWPLTAYAPTDKESWREYFKTLKQYGLNHVRFHSWCPPEACFAAADEEGFYLQPELTIWGEIDKDQKPLLEFLDADMEAIIEDYGHHPSFVMFAIGNELWGDTNIMKTYIDKAREMQPGLLATYGSNIYLGHLGHVEGEDYLVTCRVGDGDGFSTHSRASFSFADADNGGILNSTYPNTRMTFSDALAHSPVPVVGHETGQYQIYPDYSTIKKYKGVLRPDNLNEFKRRAKDAGTLRKADKFAEASGKWATRLYKADMEMNLRTPEMGGFQLLDIQDYPGQGTALVGILDPFMDSKGLITPEEWRESCNDITVLAELPGFTVIGGDVLYFDILTANYSDRDLSGAEIRWHLPFTSGHATAKPGKGVKEQDAVEVKMPDVREPQKMQLSLSLRIPASSGGKEETITNNYDLWVYPEDMKPVKGVTMTSDLNEALSLLEKGKKVILTPDSATVASTTLGPLFMTDYWNYRMFQTICNNVGRSPSPGTIGLLIDSNHPALSLFPTDNHTDWQWFDIVANSRPLIIDRLPNSIDPIIEPIDNIDRNYRLAMLLECNVGKGKLLIAMTDLDKISATPEGRWFRHSLESYVASKEFKPSLSLTPRQLSDLLTIPSLSRTLQELRNISYD